MGETGAAPEAEMSVMNTCINQASTALSISAGGTSAVYGFVQKTPAGKHIYISLTLQRNYNGTCSDVTGRSSSSTSSSAYILETYHASSGTYRVETQYHVYCDGGYESGIVYSNTAIC